MHRLAITLPPFSPDYSGVCSALFELGGLLVIHDASGCTGNYTGYDEPRWYGSNSLVYCSGLRELDAVLGDDRRFVERIEKAVSDLKPRFVGFLGSPVPMVIGTDFRGIANEIESETGVPVFGFDTTGFNYYDRGASDAFCALATRFLPAGNLSRSSARTERGVNILGATPIDLSLNSNSADLKNWLIGNGFSVVSCFAMGSSLDQIQEAPKAGVNLVVSWSGLRLARFFRERYGIPFVAGLPVGRSGADTLAAYLRASSADGEDRTLSVSPSEEKADTLIIGEQVAARSIKAFLADCGTAADVACLFGVDDTLYDGDISLKSERDIRAVVNGGYKTVIADPLIKQLLKPDSGTRFVDFPHVAVSSKVHWDECVEFVGEKGDIWGEQLFP